MDEEVINNWKAYELFSRSLQGTARKTTVWDSGKTEHSTIVYKQNRECVLICISDERKSTDLCRVGNPRYAASMNRSKLDPSQVVLDQFTQHPQGAFPGYVGDRVSIFDLTRPAISPHFALGAKALSQFVVDPSFKILKVSKESENGHELVRFDYTYSHDNSKKGAQVTGRGSIYLDPSRYWCVRRSVLSSAMTIKGLPFSDQKHEYEFEVVDHPSGFPLVKTRTSHDSYYSYKTKKRLVSNERIDYDWEVNDSVADTEFTLSAFGLPEPMGSKAPERPRAWLWLIAAAVGLAVLAVFFAWLKRRHLAAGRVNDSALSNRGRT